MYNGIGLSTARGSGTNGYVQRNLSHLKPTKKSFFDYTVNTTESTGHKVNPDLLEHDRKRQIEIECIMLQDSLEKTKQYSSEEIEQQVNDLRNKLRRSSIELPLQKATDTHQLDQLKNEKMQTFKEVLSIPKDMKEGEAFQNISQNHDYRKY